MRKLTPDSVEVEFGVKLAGQAGWVFAKAATEGHLTVKLHWEHKPVGNTSAEPSSRGEPGVF
jgi:hypothetical protein